jgi:nanoRNase/pAp phosphatase (c-di-AMP/oligoRNAs hydrolase)
VGPLVVYHAGCHDGYCSAWLFRQAFPDAEFLPAHYGDTPPDVGHRDVYLVDFTYPRDAIRRLISFNHKVTVLDHHATAPERVAGLTEPDGKFEAVIDQTKSGARLAWEYLLDRRPGTVPTECPWLVAFTEDRDLWRWALPFSREVNAALRSYPLDFDGWDRMHADRTPADLIPEGRAILRREKQIVDSHVGFAREVTLAGHRVPCVNATVLTSEIAGELATGKPFGVCYFDRADGMRIYSLRSRDGGVDVSQVAKSFGGGGHVRAAGFEVRRDADPVTGGTPDA